MLVTTQVKQNAEAILDSKSVKNDYVALGNVHVEIFPLLFVKCSKFYSWFDGIRTLYGFGFSYILFCSESPLKLDE